MSDYQMFEVQVSQVEPLTEQVKRFTLVATDGKPLPAFTGGSHIIVQMSDGDNQY
ncbi:TPA: oxidoreductase, partial [Escherichia coli]|nr:oxidoreductase [Escherichia coli]